MQVEQPVFVCSASFRLAVISGSGENVWFRNQDTADSPLAILEHVSDVHPMLAPSVLLRGQALQCNFFSGWQLETHDCKSKSSFKTSPALSWWGKTWCLCSLNVKWDVWINQCVPCGLSTQFELLSWPWKSDPPWRSDLPATGLTSRAVCFCPLFEEDELFPFPCIDARAWPHAWTPVVQWVRTCTRQSMTRAGWVLQALADQFGQVHPHLLELVKGLACIATIPHPTLTSLAYAALACEGWATCHTRCLRHLSTQIPNL